jgi:hypothetical protein
METKIKIIKATQHNRDDVIQIDSIGDSIKLARNADFILSISKTDIS